MVPFTLFTTPESLRMWSGFASARWKSGKEIAELCEGQMAKAFAGN
jgi:hypothetical protein